MQIRQQLVASLTCLSLVGCGGSDDTSATPAVVVPASVIPEVSIRATRIVDAFESFLDENRIQEGAIAVSHNASLVQASGSARSVESPQRVASLSKSITALCTLRALEQTGGSIDMTLAEVLPQKLALHPNRDLNIDSITVRQLITHNSGLRTAYVSNLGEEIGLLNSERKDFQLASIVDYGLGAAPGSGFFYANSNYLLLGMVIESWTGEDYQNYCEQQLFAPLGISSARLSNDWAFLSSYGGWEISAVDYLRFIDANFTADTIAGRPSDEISSELNNVLEYGPGVTMRSTTDGYVYWHFGAFNWRSSVQSGSFGAYFAVYNNGYTVSVNYSQGLSDELAAELDNALYLAANSEAAN